MIKEKARKWFTTAISDFSAPLIVGVVLAVVWANVAPHSYHELMEHEFAGPLSIHFVANDIIMVFFFGLAAKEITEAVLPGGALNPPSKAINPLMGTLGGVLGPIGVYFVMCSLLGAKQITQGWGIPTATDIALAWLAARLAFGKGHPAVKYLLLLAVADDALGLGIIAIFYPDPEHPVEPTWLALLLIAMGIAYIMRRRDLAEREEGKAEDEPSSYWKYLVIPGGISWFALHNAHLHPALALVPIVPFMPAAEHDEGLFDVEEAHKKDTLNRFEHTFKIYVDAGLFLFGLANAGVEFAAMGPATWAVLVALLVGKTLGITVFGGLAHAFGAKLPKGMTLGTLVLSGYIAALGLTVALFVAGAAFTDPVLQGSAKMGALFSALAFSAVLIARIFKVKRIEEEVPEFVVDEPMPETRRESAATSAAE